MKTDNADAVAIPSGTAKPNTANAINQTIKEQAAAEQRLKAWAEANPKDPLAEDIQNTLLELWAIRLDYQRDILKTA